MGEARTRAARGPHVGTTGGARGMAQALAIPAAELIAHAAADDLRRARLGLGPVVRLPGDLVDVVDWCAREMARHGGYPAPSPGLRAILDAMADPAVVTTVVPMPGATPQPMRPLVCGIPDATPRPDATPTAPVNVWHPCNCDTQDTVWHGGDTPDPLRGLSTPLPAPMEGGGGVP